jgi:hypothetical protein
MWKYLTFPEVDFATDFLNNKKVTEDQKHRIRVYFNKMVRLQNKKRLAFKITGPSRIDYLMSIFPDACFVNITRDPKYVIKSFLLVDFWKNRGYSKLYWKGAYSKKEIEFAEQYKKDPLVLTTFQIKKLIDYTKFEAEKFKPDYIDVAYEDFIKNPKEIITTILDFVKLSHDDECFKYLEENKIIDRNEPNHSGFTEKEESVIKEILEKDIDSLK